ncbi:MAG: GNAT family N-acetyltransferase [Antricoccus sp.]
MQIRPYEQRDREAALKLAPRLVAGIAPWRDEHAARASYVDTVAWSIDHSDGDQEMAVFVAEDDDGLAGIVTVMEKGHFTGQKDAYVEGLAVGERRSRSGVGTELMSAAEGWGRKRGHTRLLIETGAANKVAREFYGAIGYEEEEVKLSKAL